jgi:hypothetical protein
VQGAARAGSGAGAGCASAYDLPATARREVKWAEGVDVEWAIHPQSTRLPSTSGVKLATQPCGTRQAGPLRAGAHLRQIILSWLNLRARICSDGSMMPPRRRSTRWSVDSAARATPASDKGALLARPGAQTAAEIVALSHPEAGHLTALTLLDVVVCQRPAILELLAGENQALLVGRDACARTG